MEQPETKRRRITIEYQPLGGKPTIREFELEMNDKVHYHSQPDEHKTAIGFRLGITRANGSQETYLIPFTSLLYIKLEV